MVYQKLSNEELQKFRYPNLIAELIESGYSICTLSEHMKLGKREEDDPEIWAKLKGSKDILTNEAIGLSQLFNTKMEYLFDHTLRTLVDGKTYAEVRWFDAKQKEEQNYREYQEREEIYKGLKEKPYLYEFMKMALSLDSDEVKALTQALRKENEDGENTVNKTSVFKAKSRKHSGSDRGTEIPEEAS